MVLLFIFFFTQLLTQQHHRPRSQPRCFIPYISIFPNQRSNTIANLNLNHENL
ncbi:hypothetical protein Scep_001484 [Stephania cephalantha]|uniref:Uncharacterized protein n=1 Tax=Stephania cephalantha TaxID=152367 RepID=A0AAP0L9F5_9MAGN